MPSKSRRNLLKATVAAAATTSVGKAKADVALIRSLPIMTRRASSSESEIKKRAIADYHANMRQFGGSLACHGRPLLQQAPRAGVPWNFDVLIVGSGYGASICAARLAMAKRPGVRLAVIERGREWIPGTFGDTFLQATRESRFQLFGRDKNTIENPVGLVNAMRNDEVNVLSGSGLGGSSLINANVALRPDRECFEQSSWPVALRDRSVLDPYYDQAAWELGVASEPPDLSPKSRAQRLASRNLAGCGAHFEQAGLTVTRVAGEHTCAVMNRQGMRQRGCIGCGDCCSGCNVGAKNTLAMNYLPLAKRFGAEMYTHTEVIRVEKVDGYYRVHFKVYSPKRDGGYHATCSSVTSRIVILGAGSVGSNEIMLRSRGIGMELSDRVGHQWSMNGDALGFIRKSRYLPHSGGRGAYGTRRAPVGPTIQTNLTYPARPHLHDRVLIQDGSVSKSYANILGTLMQDMDLDSTLIMLGMGHDGAGGRVTLRGDGLGKITWPGIKESAYRKKIRGEFQQVAKAHGGKYKYLKLFGDNFITVHPLGGCAMADDPMYGVVDHRGRVFDAAGGGREAISGGSAGVHSGFFIADGAIVPSALAANPLLTISALAERIAEHITIDSDYVDLFGSPAMAK
ncbi:MAG: GMC family oxidoreductase [Pirellulaceae bacterium]|nr:GMC family oxidoreductase [Pirellulaceae bacterium]